MDSVGIPILWLTGVVSGIQGKQMMPQFLNEAFSAKIKIIICQRAFRVAVNTYVPIFWGLDARGGRKL